MPEFSEEDKTAYRTLLVHFIMDEDIEKIKKYEKQEFTEKTKFIYFPEQENMDTEAKRYD